MRRIKRIKASAGETLVEVMASMFIFLIMIGVLQGAISYSNSALTKNKEIRAENAAILQGLQSTGDVTKGSQKTVGFLAADSELTQTGNRVFSMNVTLNSKNVTYQDADGRQQSTTFYFYGSLSQPASDQTDAEGGNGS